MTIGLAAYGPRAGEGILAGLAAVEKVGRGAIGGFVSLAAITETGDVLRAETQTSGQTSLQDNPNLAAISAAPWAALISSGPNRPEPLAAFVWADAEVGLVTGHRMPQLPDPEGHPLNARVGEMMRAGNSPQAAIDAIVAGHPNADAGFLALSRQGEFGLGNTAHVLARRDLGQHIAHREKLWAAALHNSIQPQRPLALLAVEAALDAMEAQPTQSWVTIPSGIPVAHGTKSEVWIDKAGRAERILHIHPPPNSDEWSFGLGDWVPVAGENGICGVLGYEPYMVQRDGRLLTIDGAQERRVPVLELHRKSDV